MGCGCGKKRDGTAMAALDTDPLSPAEWGPILWKYLHCIAEKIGTTGNKIFDTDQANYMETLLTMLPIIIPCTECQGHAAAYIAANPIPTLRGLYGSTLQSTIRLWLFVFHNSVRTATNQPIIINTIEECSALYAGCSVPQCEYNSFVKSVAAAVRKGWVRIDNWKKWFSNSERLRILTGNVVV